MSFTFEKRERIKETSILLKSDRKEALKAGMDEIIRNRLELEGCIKARPEFSTSLEPLPCKHNSPEVIRLMCGAGAKAGVGPMAAVAGSIAELATKKMTACALNAIAENGGDISLMGEGEVNISIFAGESGIRGVGLRIDAPAGVCTSSGKVGHSISLGCADAVTVIAEQASVADAFATGIANQVREDTDLKELVQKSINEYVNGVLIIRGNEIAFTENLAERMFQCSGRKKFSEGLVELG